MDVVEPSSITRRDAPVGRLPRCRRRSSPTCGARRTCRCTASASTSSTAPTPATSWRRPHDLSPDEVADIARPPRSASTRPAAAGRGPPTTLDLIADRPGVRAADLAASVGRETQPFKLDVRKLKGLGLTLSLEVGYRLSPRGEAFRRQSTER